MKFIALIIAFVCTTFCGALFADSSTTNSIAWKVPRYSLVARQMSLSDGFKTFGATQGISVILSKEVVGVFSGEFRNMPADEFLDRVTTLHNLIWYFDGSTLYIYGSSEVISVMNSLRYMKADEVVAMLRDLGIEDKRFPIRTASNDELILVSGPPRYVALIGETIARADKLREDRTFNEIETRIFPLRYTWAEDVTMRVTGPESSVPIRGIASVIRDLMGEMGETPIKELDAKDDENGAKNGDEKAPVKIEKFRPVIKPENRMNAVVVRDVITRMPIYERLIKELDKPQQLIEISVTKIELSRNDALDWQLSLAVSGAHKEISAQAGQNATMSQGQSANIIAKQLIGRGLAGAMTYLGDSVTVNGSLHALREKGKGRNISRSSLLTVNNFAARISDTQSYHVRVVGTEVANLQSVSVGTSLEIKPRVITPMSTNESTRVWLSLQLKDGGFKAVEVDSMPMTSDSTVETQALVPVGESILLAGYTRDVKEEGGWGIPYLRDIPWIGWIFGGKSWSTETVQRFFILTPHVMEVGYADMGQVQVVRHRDLNDAYKIEYDSDVDSMARKEEDARRDELRLIQKELAEDTFERNEGERKFRREQRRDTREESMEAWEKDLGSRREAYREDRKARREAQKEAEEKQKEEGK